MITHPGYKFMLLLLTQSPLLSKLFDLVCQGNEKVVANEHHERAVVYCMRILLRAIDLQASFVRLT